MEGFSSLVQMFYASTSPSPDSIQSLDVDPMADSDKPNEPLISCDYPSRYTGRFTIHCRMLVWTIKRTYIPSFDAFEVSESFFPMCSGAPHTGANMHEHWIS